MTTSPKVAGMMTRLYIYVSIFILVLLCATGVQAQTVVNFTVSDTPDNQLWYNGTWSVQLIPAQGNPDQTRNFRIISGGGSTAAQNGALSTTGTASVSLPANANIAPTGTVWQFTVCPGATSGCFQQSVTVSTSSPQTLTITPPSIRISLLNPSGQQSTYSRNEISAAAFESHFLELGTSVGTPVFLVCNAVSGSTCTNWIQNGVGTVGPAGTPVQTQVNNGGSPNQFGGA